MKGLVKLGLIVILVVFATASLGFLIPSLSQTTILPSGQFQAGTEAFMLTYGLITKDATGTGIAYTPQCFECHLPINFTYSGSSAPPSKTLGKSDFSHLLNKAVQNDDVKVTDVNILMNKSFTESVWISNMTCETVAGNETSPSYERCIDNAFKLSVSKWKWVWEPLPSSITLDKGRWYVIDFVGKRSANRGSFATDIIPSINSVTLADLEWWNASYNSRTNFTISIDTPRVTIGADTTAFFPIYWNTDNKIAELQMNANCTDHVVVNSTNTQTNWVWENFTHATYGCDGTETILWIKDTVKKTNGTSIESIYYENSADVSFDNSSTADSDILQFLLFTERANNSTTFGDVSSQNTDVTVTTGTLSQERGLYGDASAWDGSSQAFISDGSKSTLFRGLTGHTSFALFKIRDQGVSYIWSNRQAVEGLAWFYDPGFNYLNCYYEDTTGTNAVYTGQALISDVWYVAVCRFTANSKTEIFLLNTTHFIRSVDNVGVGAQMKDGGRVSVAGESNGGAPERMNGVIDAILHVNRTLSDDEVNATMLMWLNRNFTLITEQAAEGGQVESTARISMETGIKRSLGNDVVIYTDQQIYARYLNTSQQLARFDKVTKYGNQIWAFNYVPTGQSFTNMQNITPAFHVREISGLTNTQITDAVSSFINGTKVS